MFKPLPRQAVMVHDSSNSADRLTFWQAEFEAYMTGERGFSSATTRGRRWIMKRFLKTVATGDSPVVLTVKEVDAFLQSLGEQDGYSRVSLQTVAGCLRSFCRYAATRGWCEGGVADAIKTPRVYSLDSVPMGPSWEDVKRLLALTEGDKPTDIRARAILMLLAIYALRAGEVKHLRLDDFDWEREL